jgi:hypothetical protein
VDEWTSAPIALVVNEPREKLLARTCLADDQHGGLRTLGGLFGNLDSGPEHRAGPDELGKRGGRLRRLQLGSSGLSGSRYPFGELDQAQQDILVDGTVENVADTELWRNLSTGDRFQIRDQNDLAPGSLFFDSLNEFKGACFTAVLEYHQIQWTLRRDAKSTLGNGTQLRLMSPLS